MLDKTQIAHALKEASHAIGLSSWLARRHTGVMILMLHDVGGIEYPAEEFERQVLYLRERYHLVGIEDALDAIASARQSPRTKLVLTFDDGLRNHADTVYPILKRLGVPAVFYVCPGLIDTGRWAWNFEASARLDSLDRAARIHFAAEAGATATDTQPLVEWMKWLPAARRRALVERIRAVTPGFVPNAEQRRRYDPISWSQLLALDPDHVTIGSHTLTHPILPMLDPDEVMVEVRQSREVLQARLQRPVDHFCYPNGATSPAVSAALSGFYRSAVVTEGGIARPGDDPFHLPRIPVARRLSGLSWRLHRPT